MIETLVEAVRRRMNGSRPRWSKRGKAALAVAPAINRIHLFTDESVPIHDAQVSVIIPVKNAGDGFGRLLSTVQRQRGFAEIEIVVVDSGSTDGSVQVAEQHGAKVIKIAPEEFSHSHARNLAAEQASGNYLLFTVQDALPPSDLWLHELFGALKDNDVVAVSCTEFPRADADLFYRAISWNHYRLMQVEHEDRVMRMPERDDHLAIRRSGQLSNVACLISRDVFREHQFRGNYAEDLDLGIRLIKHGYEFVFLSSTKIIHSHNRPGYYYLKRGYVDELVISRLFPERAVVQLEAEALYSDIVFTNNLVHSILHHELGRFSVPCSVEALARVVRQRFRRARKDPYPASLAFSRTGYLDGEFGCFLESVHRNHYVRASDPRYRRTLLDEMQGYTNVLFEYMNGTYETIDGTVLEEFKVALYKLFALVCGLNLGSCFFWGDEGIKGKLKDINEELCKAV